MSASTYKRCPLTGDKKCRVLVEKLPGPVNCELQRYKWNEDVFIAVVSQFKQLQN